MNEKDDSQLLKEYVEGNIQAFELLYARHKGGTYRFFLRQADQEIAEDLVQELWKKVISNAARFESGAKFTTWLYKMARNLVIDRHRHLSVVENIIVADASSGSGNSAENDVRSDLGSNSQQPDWQHGAAMQQRALLGCIGKLPAAQKESFLLKQEAGFTHSEIANIVGASLEATKTRVKTAVKNLRDCVSSYLAQEVA